MNAVAEIRPKSVLLDMANRYGMEPPAFEATVRATCMKPDKNGKVPSREEFAAFLLVAKEYNLNPLLKEIYAFPAKGGGIVPIVSVDGWVNLINSQDALDGIEFAVEHDDKGALVSITCRIYRKDRSRPIEVTEYLVECVRQTEPWAMKHRMLRHKALIQCARYAFGFAGIYDEDEGEKIANMKDVTPPKPPAPPAPPSEDTAEVIEERRVEKVIDGEIINPHEDANGIYLDPTQFFETMEAEMAQATTAADVEEVWTARDPMAVFDGDDINQGIAKAIKNRRLKQIGG
ncbi:phage recombination protein Bet [Rhizobium sp. BK316]|uniref:recombinase RecT n=1 Tax=Rhizobium sp. BK316 TaxID=2587053 RepID=UPI0016075BF1|nr:recombinase RecT [Rhizobium sp. BK316]MBB3411270.1 phage recombination protein Bet [Rhizobium sp. BK316]